MKKESLFAEFKQLYKVQKTLRFELIPQGNTLENMKKNNVFSDDKEKYDKYPEAKKIIDAYYRNKINIGLSHFKFKEEDLRKYFELYTKNEPDNKEEKEFKKLKSDFRKSVSKAINNGNIFKMGEVLKEIKKDFENGEIYLESFDVTNIEKFNDFASYFEGFKENRKNIFTSSEKSTSVAYRIVDENLPKFINNIKIYEKNINNKHDDLKNTLLSIAPTDFFALSYFNNCLNQKGIENYNTILGGFSLENDKKEQGINEKINLYTQNKNLKKGQKIPKLSPLFKQILAETKSSSFVISAFENDEEVLNSIGEYSEIINSNLKEIKLFIKSIKNYNLKGVYLKNDESLTKVSKKLYGDWGFINKALENDYDIKKGKVSKTEKQIEKREKDIKKVKAYSIHYLNSCLEQQKVEKNICDYFVDSDEVFENVENSYGRYKNYFTNDYVNKNKLSNVNEAIEIIKTYLDNIKELQWFVKKLSLSDLVGDKDESFYFQINEYMTILDESNGLYNKVRNYITKKDTKVEKMKLNFRKPTILEGWDKNKESDNLSVLFKKDELYYLGIINKNNSKIFSEIIYNTSDSYYEKMEYKYFPDASKMVTKCTTQRKDVVKHFKTDGNTENLTLDVKTFNEPITITKEIFDLNNLVYDEEKNIFEYKDGDSDKRIKKIQKEYVNQSGDVEGYKEALAKWIEFCKEFFKKYGSTYNQIIEYKPSNEYKDLSEFYKEAFYYNISFSKYSEKYIDALVSSGKLYLFKIYNKDFSEYSRGKPNLHTMYWKLLFDENNLKSKIFKLNGGAEMFYRKKSIEEENKVVHKRNTSLSNKNINNKKKTSTFKYDIVKDKRYTVDKFQFHVPITINAKSDDKSFNMNYLVNAKIKKTNDVHVIGIDRGERHLLYVSVVNGAGEIVEQKSLNEIINVHKGKEYKTDYHKLLQDKETERDNSRKNWKTIENIKELKEGYLSQVINYITTAMLQYNAIIVLEDLNFGFKKGRFKVEKQVYQKFEKMLIDKLNYLGKKDRFFSNAGSVYNGYQLTSKFESFQKLGKQSGFLYYVNAWNTSKIDPTTGYVNFIFNKYESIEKSKKFFNTFDEINFDSNNNYFIFKTDFKKFNNKALGKTKWSICSYGTRIINFRNKDKNNQWDSKEVDATKELISLFMKYDIDYKQNLKKQILIQDDKAFFEKLLNYVKAILSLRNSEINSDYDYIVSPVKNANNQFFDSREYNFEKEESRLALPNNADSNGAYHIALKGLLLIEKIKESTTDKVDLKIGNEEWLSYVQNR